jgi:L-asparaginase
LASILRALTWASPRSLTSENVKKELPMQASVSPSVAVFGLGGTIAMAQAAQGGVSPALSASDLLAAVPGLSDVQAGLRVQDFRNKPGASLDFSGLYGLADAIDEALNDGCVGAVVTQGTDTIEEVAYVLDLLLSTDAPVVVTGAMRNPTMAGGDGPANILAAIKVAASPRAMAGMSCRAQRSGPCRPLGPEGPHRRPCCLRVT